jgi:hypothetical protein
MENENLKTESNNANVLLGEVVMPSYDELLDCIHNLMGAFDTPIARRQIDNSFANKCRKIGRYIMERTGRNNFT